MSHLKISFLLFSLFSFFACSTTVEKPKMFSRTDWGAIDSSGLVRNHSINRITIHHGGESFAADKNVFTYLKNLQSWSRREKKWVDVPYHYLIAPNGDIFEGRPDSLAGDTNTTYDPSGHLLICALGNFEEVDVPAAQYKSLVFLTKKFMGDYSVSIDSIRTHKDYAETLCPGKNLYRFFEDGSFIKSIKSK